MVGLRTLGSQHNSQLRHSSEFSIHMGSGHRSLARFFSLDLDLSFQLDLGRIWCFDCVYWQLPSVADLHPGYRIASRVARYQETFARVSSLLVLDDSGCDCHHCRCHSIDN